MAKTNNCKCIIKSIGIFTYYGFRPLNPPNPLSLLFKRKLRVGCFFPISVSYPYPNPLGLFQPLLDLTKKLN